MLTKMVCRMLLVVLLLFSSFVVSASQVLDGELLMRDSTGNTIYSKGFSGLANETNLDSEGLRSSSYSPAELLPEDYIAIYEHANELLARGRKFRLCRLQLQTSDADCDANEEATTDEEKLRSYYESFRSRNLLDAYCLNFVIDDRGYCAEPNEQEETIRNDLMQARRLFVSLYLVRNEESTFYISEQKESIKRQGLQGILNATRELAYAHMIFGSEYAIDAFSYQNTLGGLTGNAACEAELERYQQNLGQPFSSENTYFADQYFKDAECIIQHEIALFRESLKQYQFAIDVLTSAYHEDFSWPMALIIGELFSLEEVQIFAVALENYARVVDELAIRHRQLGHEADAIALYQDSYDLLLLLSLPLLQRADVLYKQPELNDEAKALLESNALAVRAGHELMARRLQEIENKVNVFGFTPDYVPVQSYAHMRDAANTLFDWAENTVNGPNGAVEANRQFELNRDKLNAEMRSIRDAYKGELVNLCGKPFPVAPETNEPIIDAATGKHVDPLTGKLLDEEYDVCVGSAGTLMEQSWLSLSSATLGMNLANRRIEAAIQEISDIQATTGEIIKVRYQTSEEIAALTLAQGMARAYQVTEMTSSSVSDEIFEEESTTLQTVTTPGLLADIPDNLDNVDYGLPSNNDTDRALEFFKTEAGIASSLLGSLGSVAESIPVYGAALSAASGVLDSLFGGTERSMIQRETKGKRHSETETSSTSTVWNPSEIEIAELQNVIQMAQLAQDVTILNIEQEARIRGLFRQIAQMQIEKEQAVVRFNQAVSEHKRLGNRWRFVQAQFSRAQEDLNANYLANPAFRLLKDHKTEEASSLMLYAAKQAYLTANALEYHLADEIPFVNDAFKARHPTHLKAYLHKLDALNRIGEGISETKVEFSLRVFASDITDQDIANAPASERQALNQLRQERFQTFLDEHLIKNEQDEAEKLVLVFNTSLDDRPFSSVNRYNWRIAGAQTGSTAPTIDRCPSRKPYGVTVDITQGQQTLPNDMEVRLVMSGHTATRQPDRTIARYTPQLVTLLPQEDLPDSIRQNLTEAVADASIDVNNPENTISDFCNMSVAASTWILEVPLRENQIDYKLFQDIILKMWTFYYS